MQNLRIGIAGYGIVGKRRHKSLLKIKKIKVVAICDKKIKKERKNSSGIKLLKNYKKLLIEDIDAIIICMTNDIAPVVTLEAINKNIHVFCEKPPGRNMEDILKVIRAYKQKPNLKIMYGFNHRYHYSIDYAKNVIDKKKFGRVISLRGVYGKSKMITFNQNDWRTKRKIAGGGVLLDQGIHLIDLMRYFVGEFNEVKSFVSNDYWKFDVEDNVYAIMKTSDNIFASIQSSATQWKHVFNLEINFEKALVILSGLKTSSKSYGNETLKIIKKNMIGYKNNEIIKNFNIDQSMDIEINKFINSIIKNKKIVSGSCFEAYKTMKIVFDIYYQDKTWRKKFNIKKPYNLNV